MPPAAGDPRVGVEVERVFIGAGCNRVVNNVSWGACGLVAFGAQNAVALFSPSRGEIVTTLPGHKASVNCTLWLPTKKDVLQARRRETHYLLSGSSDGAIMAWKIGSGKGEWSHALQLPGMHKKGVTCLAGRMVSNNVAIFASTSSDGTVVIWEMAVEPTAGGSCEVSSLYSLSVGSKPMVSLSLAVLPGQEGRLILAMAGLDHKVHIYCGDQSGKFIKACELKGHSDWIRSLDFSLPVMMGSENHSLFLVSSSQDRTIRIWKMTSDAVSSGSTVQSRKENIGMTSYIEGPLFVAGNTSYQVLLESLLVGHEDWVYSVEWQPPMLLPGDEAHQPMSILSASMDKMMMVWRPEKNTGLWINSVTVGELSHSALGFYGGHWEPDGKSILAHGYGGSFHMWRDVGVDSENWQPRIVPSGHFAPVSDLTWSRSGEYLLSVSHDQTTRIFAPWKSQVNPGDAQSAPVADIWLWEVGTWKAVGRLQYHNLTVTQMKISCDNSFLLSVSRDWHLSVFSTRKTEEGAEHHLVAKQGHKSIVWACSWNMFGYEFATGSRDKTVKIWCVQDASSVKLLATLPQFHDSVTSLAWMGHDRARDAGLLAVGMDNGMIELWSILGEELPQTVVRIHLSALHAYSDLILCCVMCQLCIVYSGRNLIHLMRNQHLSWLLLELITA